MFSNVLMEQLVRPVSPKVLALESGASIAAAVVLGTLIHLFSIAHCKVGEVEAEPGVSVGKVFAHSLHTPREERDTHSAGGQRVGGVVGTE